VHPRGGAWLTGLALILAFCASLQIGGVYSLWCGLVVIGDAWMGKRRFPWAAAIAGGLMLVGLVALVKFGYPQLWTGFQEHARSTPSVTGWRVPRVVEMLKAVRTAPGVLAVGVAMAWAVLRGRAAGTTLKNSPAGVVAFSGALAAMALISVSFVFLTANTIHIANYIQPVVVGGFLSPGLFFSNSQKASRAVLTLFLGLSLVTGVRAIGMTIWGVICARDMSYAEATKRVRAEVDTLVSGGTVIASAAYLYDLASRTNITWIHSDWPAPPDAREQWESRALVKLRPAKIIVTQFDFYRRYGLITEQLKSQSELVSLRVSNTAGVPSPDSFPKIQRILQHVSWAPVIVDLTWK